MAPGACCNLSSLFSRESSGRSYTMSGSCGMQSGMIPVLLVILLGSSAMATEASLSAPQLLRCEYLVDPLGIDVARPRLSWVLTTRDAQSRGVRQTARQVLVASSTALLARDKADFWDSGKVQSDQSIQIEYSGKQLKSGERCCWKVRVWDAADLASPWSEPANWSMGLLDPADWTAQWITGPEPAAPEVSPASKEVSTLPLLRKCFRIDRPVRGAMLHVTSLGYHRVDLNGRKVGDHELDPVQSDYSRRVYYVTHDVTRQVQQGDNALAVSLGKGWYWRGLRGIAQDRPALLLELIVSYEDDTQLRIASDASWKTAAAPVQRIGGRRGAGGDFGVELFDARRQQPGWNLASFDDSKWNCATVLQLPPIQRSSQRIAPNRVVARIGAVAIQPLQAGQYLLDFGTNLTGRLRMKLAGSAGDEIRFAYYASHTGDPKTLVEDFRQADRYICGGGRDEEFCSQFNWRAFRFVKVVGLASPPRPSDAVAELITTDLPRSGNFECSDPVLNRIHNVAVHTHRCVTLGGIQVDCPHRERLGYGAEGQGGLMQALYNFDAANFYGKWARDFQDGQDARSGMVYYTAPFRIYSGGGPAWSGACIVYPWHVYLFYGDRRILDEGYPTMRRWLDCLDSHCRDGLLQPYGLPAMNIWQYLGDWASPRRPGDTLPCNGHWTSPEENQVFNNLHYYLQLKLAGRIAAILGKDDDARLYRERALALCQTINRTWFDPQAGRYTRGEQQQTYLGFPLLLDVVPAEHRARVLENLVGDIVDKRGGHLDFGVLGGVYTLACLVHEGRSDLVYRMATVPTWPSWRNMIDRGATTLWEHWRPGDSSIHNSFLSIGGWFFSGLAGIVPDTQSPGFRNVLLRPQPAAGVTWAKTSYASMYGPITSEWKVEGALFTLDATIPVGSTATVYCPAKSLDSVREGGKPAAQAEGVRPLRMDRGEAVFEVRSGRYRFVSVRSGGQ